MPKLTKQEFYDKYYEVVSDSVKGTGLYPETVIAQMGIESGWGGSGLTTKYNNFFGIKGKGTNMATEEEVNGKRVKQNSNFRTYNSVEDSIKDYIKVLKTQGGGKTYAKVFEAKTPEAQAEAIGNSPYSTSSTYGQSIKSTINASKKNIPQKYRAMPKDEIKDFDEIMKQSKSRDLTADELKYVQRYSDVKRRELKGDEKGLEKFENQVKSLETSVKIQKFKKKYSKAKKRLTELEKLDYMAMSDEEYAKNTQEQDALKEYVGAVTEKALGKDYKKKEGQSDWDEFTENFKPMTDYFNNIDEKIGDMYMGVDKPNSPEAKEVKDYESFANDMADVDAEFQNIEFDDEVVAETEDPATTEIEVDADGNPITDGGGSGSGGSKSSTSNTSTSTTTSSTKNGGKGNIETRGDRGTDEQGNDATEGTTNWAEIAEKRKQELDALNAVDAEQFDFQYAPDNQNDNDVLANLFDVGRGAVGLSGAMEEVPTYQRGSMWNKAMDTADRMSEEGLSADELNYRNQQSETAYAYNLKNIRRGVGGSAGAYLGNVQSAAAGLYGDYGKTAAIDEEVRRGNRQNFQQMAGKDEVINRQIFQDDLTQTLRNKEQGASLVSDAINNIQERKDYNKKYGKDSASYAYKKALTKDMESDVFYREKGDRDRMAKAKREAQYEYDKAIEKVGDKNVIDGGQNDKLVAETMAKENAKKESLIPGSGDNLVNSVRTAPKTEYNKETGELDVVSPDPTKTSTEIPSKSFTETDEDGNTITRVGAEESKANITAVEKANEPAKLKEEFDILIDAEKYGGLTKEQQARKKELKGLI